MTQRRATLNTSTHVSTSTPLAAALEPAAAGPHFESLPRTHACLLLHIDKEERDLLLRLLQRAAREVRQELSITETKEVRALIEPREVLLTRLLERVQAGADRG